LSKIEEIFKVLFDKYGPQYWWPADSPFEVIIGAILTQNTNWNNVEKAINNLKKENILSPEELYKIDVNKLETLIRSSGFYKIKAERIKNFLNFLFENYEGKLEKMNLESTLNLRKKLLMIKGLGKETVDSIILYAFNRPIFVIDKYTRNIFTCLSLTPKVDSYDEWQNLFQKSLFPIYQLFNEYHALLVRHAKERCRKCEGNCFLKEIFFLETLPTY